MVIGLNKEEDGGGRETVVLVGEIRTRGRDVLSEGGLYVERERERESYFFLIFILIRKRFK